MFPISHSQFPILNSQFPIPSSQISLDFLPLQPADRTKSMSQYLMKQQLPAFCAGVASTGKNYDSRNGEVHLCRRRALAPCRC